MTNTMSVAEAMANAREYDKKHEDIPSVSRTLADEIERLERELKVKTGACEFHRNRANQLSAERTAPEPLAVASFPYPTDRDGWICSVCHGWNVPKDRVCMHSHLPPELKSNLTPGPIEPMPPDYIVQCRCGWMGNVSALKSLPDFKRGCPRCSAEFKPFAPQPFELPPLRDDDPYRQCSVCGRKSWDEPDIQAICLMPQPNRTRCPGVLRPAQRTNDGP